MDSIITDGLYFPFTTDVFVGNTGGAPPPCPDPVTIIELKPEIASISVEDICDPGVEGSVIEELDGWRWAFAGDQATQTFWGAHPSYGGDLARLDNDLGGVFSLLQSTGALEAKAIGIQRVSHAVRGDDTSVGFFQDRNLVGAPASNFANPGSQDLHLRMIVKDPFDQTGATPIYFQLLDGSVGIFTLGSLPAGQYSLAYGSYAETIAVGTANIWTFIDFQIRPADATTQVELFINGVDLTASLTQPGSLVADAFTANPGVALMNAVAPTGLTPALNVQVLFAGVAVGRTIQYARHQADASALGIT